MAEGESYKIGNLVLGIVADASPALKPVADLAQQLTSLEGKAKNAAKSFGDIAGGVKEVAAAFKGLEGKNPIEAYAAKLGEFANDAKKAARVTRDLLHARTRLPSGGSDLGEFNRVYAARAQLLGAVRRGGDLGGRSIEQAKDEIKSLGAELAKLEPNAKLRALQSSFALLGSQALFSGAQVAAGFAGGTAAILLAVSAVKLLNASFVSTVASGEMKSLAGLQGIADQTQTSVRRMYALRLAAQSTGIEVDTITRSMIALSRAQGQINNEGSTPGRYLRRYHVTKQDDSYAALLKVAEGLSREAPGDRPVIAEGLFNRGGSKLLTLLKGGSAGVEAQVARGLRNVGGGPNAELFKQIQAYNQASVEAENISITNVAKMHMVAGMAQPLTDLTTQWGELKLQIGEAVGELAKFITPDAASTVTKIGNAVKYLADSFKDYNDKSKPAPKTSAEVWKRFQQESWLTSGLRWGGADPMTDALGWIRYANDEAANFAAGFLPSVRGGGQPYGTRHSNEPYSTPTPIPAPTPSPTGATARAPFLDRPTARTYAAEYRARQAQQALEAARLEGQAGDAEIVGDAATARNRQRLAARDRHQASVLGEREARVLLRAAQKNLREATRGSENRPELQEWAYAAEAALANAQAARAKTWNSVASIGARQAEERRKALAGEVGERATIAAQQRQQRVTHAAELAGAQAPRGIPYSQQLEQARAEDAARIASLKASKIELEQANKAIQGDLPLGNLRDEQQATINANNLKIQGLQEQIGQRQTSELALRARRASEERTSSLTLEPAVRGIRISGELTAQQELMRHQAAMGGGYTQKLEGLRETDRLKQAELENKRAGLLGQLEDLTQGKSPAEYFELPQETQDNIAKVGAELDVVEGKLRAGQHAAEEFANSMYNVGPMLSGLMADAITGIAQGTVKLEDAGKRVGQAFIGSLIKKTIEEKTKGFDLLLEKNFLEYIPKIAGLGGEASGESFGEKLSSGAKAAGKLFGFGDEAAIPTAPSNAPEADPVAALPLLAAAFDGASMSDTSPAGEQLLGVPFRQHFLKAAARHGVRAPLLAGIAKAESDFDPTAISRAGARGVMQLTPANARGIDPFNAAQSIDTGAGLMGRLLDKYNGNERFALAAYNAGEGAVAKHGGVPPFRETRQYVPKVLSFAKEYEGRDSGAKPPVDVRRILQAKNLLSKINRTPGRPTPPKPEPLPKEMGFDALVTPALGAATSILSGIAMAANKSHDLRGEMGVSQRELTRETYRAGIEGATFGFLPKFITNPLGDIASGEMFGGGTFGRTLGGVAMGTPFGPAGMVIGGILGASGLLKPKMKTTGTITRKPIRKLMGQLGIPRVAEGNKNINLDSGGISDEYLEQGGLGGGFLLSASNRSGNWGRGTFRTDSVRNAILQNAIALGLAPETAGGQYQQMVKGFAGKSLDEGVLKLLALRKRGKDKYKPGDDDIVATTADMLRAFEDLPKAIDASTVALELFDSKGRVNLEHLKRSAMDAKEILGSGISGALGALQDSGSTWDAGIKLAESFSGGFNKRVEERLLDSTRLGTVLTKVSTLTTQAAEALVAGDMVAYRRLTKEATTLYKGELGNVTKVLSDIGIGQTSFRQGFGLPSIGGLIDQTGSMSSFGSSQQRFNSYGYFTDDAARSHGLTINPPPIRLFIDSREIGTRMEASNANQNLGVYGKTSDMLVGIE